VSAEGFTVQPGLSDGCMVARLAGGIDLANARELETRLLDRVGDADGLVLDLTEVRYLDSAGLGMIDRLARALAARQRRLALVAPEGSVAHGVLRIAQLAGVPVTASVEGEPTVVD
jgi:anti-sigma B factor antagonist